LPFRSDYEAALLYAIVHEEPPAISSLRSDVSHGLVSIIDKALQKNCNLRYQTMKEFITDLKSGCTSTIELPKQEKSIAVLPFINDSPDEENTYFINGVMEEILNNLQKVKDLRVISRTSVEQYRNQKKTIKEIAKELGVNYIVEGSGQKYGNTFRLRTQLIIAIKESQLWGESFQQEIHDVKDIFRIQSQIAEAIAKELKAAITPQEKQLIEKIPTENFAAYDAYLKGQFYWKKLTPNDLDTAIQYFEMAKEKDPGYALAYAGICDVWIGRQQMGIVPPAEAGPKAFEAAMKALELDSTRAEVHYTLALMKTWGMWDWQGGESAFKKALELNPNHAETHAYYSHFLSMMGQPTEAMGEMEMALKLDPYNPLLKGLYSMSLYMVRRFDEALVAAHDALKMDPTSVVAQSTLGDILFELGRYEEAIENYKLAIKLFGYDEVRYAFDRDYAEAGYRGAFNEVANSLVEISKTRYVLPMIIFTFYLYADNNEKALDWLEKGYEAHDPNLPYLLAFPMYVSVHHEPRFQEIARKMNLPFKN
jgi:TolB-like protein